MAYTHGDMETHCHIFQVFVFGMCLRTVLRHGVMASLDRDGILFICITNEEKI